MNSSMRSGYTSGSRTAFIQKSYSIFTPFTPVQKSRNSSCRFSSQLWNIFSRFPFWWISSKICSRLWSIGKYVLSLLVKYPPPPFYADEPLSKYLHGINAPQTEAMDTFRLKNIDYRIQHCLSAIYRLILSFYYFIFKYICSSFFDKYLSLIMSNNV